jgi:hypothetical protein
MGNLLSVIALESYLSSRTSASTPAVAALFSLINDNLLNAGKKPLGFINPVLYQMYAANPSITHDITMGNNSVRKRLSLCELFSSIEGCYFFWEDTALYQARIRCNAWLGSHHWFWHSQLPSSS